MFYYFETLRNMLKHCNVMKQKFKNGSGIAMRHEACKIIKKKLTITILIKTTQTHFQYVQKDFQSGIFARNLTHINIKTFFYTKEFR